MIQHSKPCLGKEEHSAVDRVLSSLHIAAGPETKAFEEEFASVIGRKHCIATSSGSTALSLALKILNLTEGASILYPSYVCDAVLNTIESNDLHPHCIDIDAQSFNIPKSIPIDNNIAALIVPHMFGLPAPIEQFETSTIPVIENCTNCFGIRYREKHIGTFGKVSTFSFGATKIITGGQGGALVLDDDVLAAHARDLLAYDKKDTHSTRFNYQWTDIQASIAREQLKKLSSFIERRRILANNYNEAFQTLDITLPTTVEERVYFRYCIRTHKDIEVARDQYRNEGIELIPPVHKPSHMYLGLDNTDFMNTTDVYHSILSLPLYPALSDAEQNKVIEATKRILS